MAYAGFFNGPDLSGRGVHRPRKAALNDGGRQDDVCYHFLMLERRQLLLASLLAATGLPARADALVRYPQFPLQDRGDGVPYPVRILELALAGQAYTVQASGLVMRQSRALAELRNGHSIDTLWSVTTRQRERDLLPVRIPLDMGLIGWRLLLIRKSDVTRFAAIRSLDQLRALKAVQGSDWPDTEILRANGFRVETASNFPGMFKMLAAGRVDYFPRSVFEAERDAAAFANENLVIAPGLALHYPSALYFFVHLRNTVLAAALQQGLDRAFAEGSFQRVFRQYFGGTLQNARLESRLVFDLSNPTLPDVTPLDQRWLWFRPGSSHFAG